jgi:hypothetical protein
MFEECPAQSGAMTHAATNPLRLVTYLAEVLADEVRHQIGARQMGPEVFHGVEFGRVGRHVFHCQPEGLLAQIGLDNAAAMRRQPVPQQNRLSPPEVTLFKSVGVAVQDLAAAIRVFQFAREQGLGSEVAI